MDLDEARCQAKLIFADMKPASGRDLTEVGRREGQGLDFAAQLSAMTPEGFPLPSLLYCGLTQLLQVKTYGPYEKMRWGYCFDFKDCTFGFELRKFGLRALCEPRNLDSPVLREVLGRARELTIVAERYLTAGPIEKQIDAGDVVADNLYHLLHGRYQFLREQAEQAYKRPPPPPEVHGSGTMFHFGKPTMEGGAFGAAAVDVYFSMTEHLFFIALAVSTARSSTPSLLEFLAGNWSTKARAVLDLTDPRVKASYDHLLRIREAWRNPVAHGGFMSAGASLYVHVPGTGVLPARLRRTADGVKVGFRLSDESFNQIMAVFDQFDAVLKTGPIRFAVKWAESGLDVAFDESSVSEYRAAMASDEAFDRLIEYRSCEYARHVNMDY
jgi:hypothetical protein